MGKRLAEDINAFAYVECSAMKKEGVDEVFEEAVKASMMGKMGSSGMRPIDCCLII